MLIYDFLTYRVLRRVAVYALFGIGCLPLLAAYNPATNVDIHIWMLKIFVEKTQNVKKKYQTLCCVQKQGQIGL